MADWWVRHGSQKPIGPVSAELLVRGIGAGKVPVEAEVCRVGDREWLPLEAIEEFQDALPDDGARTHVIESPWFLEQSQAGQSGAHSAPRPLPPSPPVSRPRGAPPPLPPPISSSRGAPPSATVRIAPLPPGSLAAPPAPARPTAGSRQYGDEVDDQAMTRVDRPTTSPGTDPAISRRVLPAPRPAAGAPLGKSVDFPLLPPSAAGSRAPQPPPRFDAPRPQRTAGLDPGMKALIVLIVLLTAALAVVLVLLLRR